MLNILNSDLCGLVVRVLDFRAGGLEFDPWPGQGDYIFGQSVLHPCVLLQAGVQKGICEVNLGQTGILFRKV